MCWTQPRVDSVTCHVASRKVTSCQNVTRIVEHWCRCRERLICNMSWSRSEFSVRHAGHKTTEYSVRSLSLVAQAQAVFTYIIEFHWSQVLHKKYDCQISFGLHKSFHLLIVPAWPKRTAVVRRRAAAGCLAGLHRHGTAEQEHEEPNGCQPHGHCG